MTRITELPDPITRPVEFDVWVSQAVFGNDTDRAIAQAAILATARERGIYPASIHDLYMARGRGEVPATFTVPAINIRGLAYDTARALFRARQRLGAGAVILEIARSEIGYTDQRPAEYTTVMMAAALREGWGGPLFLQGDHFQINAKKYAAGRQAECQTVEALIREAITAGFYNIDIDTSTLVDLSKADHDAQQQLNGELCAALTFIVRSCQPQGVTVSVGGEIGEVGSKNSTPDDLHAFMRVFDDVLTTHGPGISKISIQTGTAHGGFPGPDGKLLDVEIDFDTLRSLSDIARREYGLAGAVQHGASTLPRDAFNQFVLCGACEVHLATNFQNMLFDYMDAGLRDRMYAWLRENAANERKPSDTDEQFIYKTRKKALGPFKRELWEMSEVVRAGIGEALEREFEFLLQQLGVKHTLEVAHHYAPFVEGSFPDTTGGTATVPSEDVSGLAD